MSDETEVHKETPYEHLLKDLSPSEIVVYTTLKRETKPRRAREITERTPELSRSRVAGILTVLVMKGFARRIRRGFYMVK